MIKTGREGNGMYGVVYSAKMHPKDTQEIAVKRNIIDPDITFSGSIREMDLLNRLRGHPYVVKLLSITFGNPFNTPSSPLLDRRGGYQEDYLHFIFEKADKNLHDVIYHNLESVNTLKIFMTQIVLAVEYMHARGVIHRDIKPGNLLWFKGNNGKSCVKLCDFGLSKVKTNQEPSSPGVVTCWYRAPEICSRDPEYSYSSDIWSVGCVFFEMVSKKALLIGSKDNDSKLLSRIIGLSPRVSPQDVARLTKYKVRLNAEASPKTKKSWSQLLGLSRTEVNNFNKYPGKKDHYDDFLKLLDSMMRLNPDERPTATQILTYSFFEPYGDIVQWSREKFPCVPMEEKTVNIVECQERSWAVQLFNYFYNERKNLDWYSHRILFQSMDLFDRYLCYYEEKGEHKIPSKNNGKYMTREDTVLRYLVCLYLSIKYFTVLTVPVSFDELVEDVFELDESSMAQAEKCEQMLLYEVYFFRLYQETVYEAADRMGRKLDEYQIRDLIEAFGSSESVTEVPVSDLLKKWLKIEYD